MKRGGIVEAPRDEPLKQAIDSKEEVKSDSKRASVNEDDILKEDFKALEARLIGEEPAEGRSLADLQRGFAIDQKKGDSAAVDEWNKRTVGTASTSDWLAITDAGQSVEIPWPDDLTWYPDETACMSLGFMQRDLSLRKAAMLKRQKTNGLIWSSEVNPQDWKEVFTDVAYEREDAHVILHSVKVKNYTACGLPGPAEIKFFTGTAFDELLRPWHTDAAVGRTATNVGKVTAPMILPGKSKGKDKPIPIYEASIEHLTNPWMSRFITFDFDAAEEILDKEYTHPRNSEYYRIKAPPSGSRDVTIVQWLMYSFFRYLKFATARRIRRALENDPTFASTVGEGVIQAIKDEKGVVTGYQYVIHKEAMKKVLAAIHDKVRPATHMAKLQRMVLALSLVGGADMAEQHETRMVTERAVLDELRVNPFVDFNFHVELYYIVIPKHYKTMALQTLKNTGVKEFTRMARDRPRDAGYGSSSFASAARRA